MKKINNIEIIILIFLLSIISFLLYNYFNTKYKNRIEKLSNTQYNYKFLGDGECRDDKGQYPLSFSIGLS